MNRWVIVSIFMWLVLVPGHGWARRQIVDRAAVVVNQKMVTEREVDTVRELTKREYLTRFKGAELEEKLKKLETKVLDQVIENLLLEARAEKNGIQITDQELDQRVKAIIQGDPRVAAVYSDQTLRDYVLRDLLKKRVLNKEVNSRIFVDDQEIRQLCKEENKGGQEVDLGHILLRGYSPEVLEKARKIRVQLQGGADFEKTAQALSEDPSVRRNRGRLGFNPRGNFFKSFEDAAFALKPGEVSQPVKTQLGYHLIKVFAVRQKGAVDCDHMEAEAARRVRDMLWSRKQQVKMMEYLADLRSNAHITILTKP